MQNKTPGRRGFIFYVIKMGCMFGKLAQGKASALEDWQALRSMRVLG